jgi:butyrate kinase
MTNRLILAINPGSTSTKFSLYEEDRKVFDCNLRHSVKELSPYPKITDQFHFRKNLVMNEFDRRKIDLDRIAAVVGRGGLIKPIESGVYKVNETMKEDLRNGYLGEHASNLGGLIADDIASSLPHAVAFIVDPVVVDELIPEARISGHPCIERRSIFHALNQKAVARMYAESAGCRYEDLNLIIAHLGGGISVGAHRKGRVVDVNNALDGDGPFSPERSGGLPSGQLVDLCFSGKFTKDQLKSMITGKGGMVAYLGTNSFSDVWDMSASGDPRAALIVEAVSLQIAKEIGAMSAVLHGKVDAVILTGGMAHQFQFIWKLKSMIEYIAPVFTYPGEDEIRALAFNALLALDGKIGIKTYQ